MEAVRSKLCFYYIHAETKWPKQTFFGCKAGIEKMPHILVFTVECQEVKRTERKNSSLVLSLFMQETKWMHLSSHCGQSKGGLIWFDFWGSRHYTVEIIFASSTESLYL